MLEFVKRFQFLLTIFAVMIVALGFGDMFPKLFKDFFFTCSVVIRAGLLFLLPFLVLPFLLSSILLLKSRGLVLLIAIMVLILTSNFIAILTAYGVTLPFVHLLSAGHSDMMTQASLTSLVQIDWEPIISIELTLVIGVLIGVVLSYKSFPVCEKFIEHYRHICSVFLSKVFIPLLPVYIFGISLQISYQTNCYATLSKFGALLVFIFLVQLVYTAGIFFIGCKGNLCRTLQCISRSLPAGLLGFSSMSSVVTMPVTLKAAEENLDDKGIARLAITSTVNTHVIGDCLSLPIIAIMIYLTTFGHVPEFSLYISFAIFLALAQFTAVSVPGGSIVVITPFLISKLGYSDEMVGLITALSIFLEPIGTAFNVMGNSGFALVIKRIFDYISQVKPQKK